MAGSLRCPEAELERMVAGDSSWPQIAPFRESSATVTLAAGSSPCDVPASIQ
jgi:hypothetical protein